MPLPETEKSRLILKTEDSFPKELLPHIDVIFDDEFVKKGLSDTGTTEITVPSEETKDICLHVGGIEIYRESVKTFDGVDVDLRYDLMVPVNLAGSRKFSLVFDKKSLPYLCDFFLHGSTKYSLPFEATENVTFPLLILNEKDSKKLVLGDESDGNIVIIEDGKNDLFIEIEEEIDTVKDEIPDNTNNQANNQINTQITEKQKTDYHSQASEIPVRENTFQESTLVKTNPNYSELTERVEDSSEGFSKVYGRMNVKKVTKLGLNPKELYEGNITRSSTGIEYQVTINSSGNTTLRRIPSNTSSIIKPLLFIAGGAALMFFSNQDKKEEPKSRAIDPVIVNNPKTIKPKRKYQIRKTK